ncbi:cytochrome c peroxidase [Pedobacter cryoconitis]|uniref:Cytochrome c peroxidase n=1 Tax=Pedobacter cryoconitis TaxID=188932 RepID=A0A7W8ZPW0_9SPHI|nr:cytochrome c peroxidase [Pedobacter cryoconitis]MBB5638009.1 cytochrome c peroxidase [Pedobacter cryoconitis]
MYQNKLKIIIQFLLFITCLSVVLGLKESTDRIGLKPLTDEMKTSFILFEQSTRELQNAVSLLEENSSGKGKKEISITQKELSGARINAAKEALKNSRMAYKRIEFFMDYFFQSSSLIYNRPAKVEVEEPYMEYQEPSGFQVIEAMLFDADPLVHQKELADQAELLVSSAADLPALLYGFDASDNQVLESVRLELVKVITLSITGYDAPELKSGIEESYQSIFTVQKVLLPYIKKDLPGSALLNQQLGATVDYLHQHPDFDSFDRMEFLRHYALPLQEQLRNFIQSSKSELQQKSVLNYEAKNIFSPDAIPSNVFPDAANRNLKMVALGKKLFLEKALSGNLKRSCASCHHPDQYFSEQLKTSTAFDGKSSVSRNAPSLLYAGFQYSQFWDGRAKSLQEQIKTVISNPFEMNGDHQVIVAELNKSADYRRDFAAAFPEMAVNAINIKTVADALAAYLGELNPRNSAFDRYMNGDSKALKSEALKGFNLFMGKAQCGSCHFAPLFNGLIPPYYKLTEYEILGTPANADFKNAKKDKDRGRHDFFPISYYEAAFKTPTVRNVEMTAPYMHNGVFKDLYQVVDFYNKGGGAGLGLDLPGQTLSAKPLNLSEKEMREIVDFMKSLTDNL